jgi:Kef-type K+ transport system membrane component KefB
VNQVGIILGPSLLGRLKIFESVFFSIKSQEIISTLSVFSYMLFLFGSGVKMDIGMIKRTGRKALFTGATSILVPLLIGLLVEMQLKTLWLEENTYTTLFLTATHCISPFPVLACLLEDLNILNSELGQLALSAAMVSNTLSIMIIIGVNLIIISKSQGSMLAAISLGSIIIYCVILAFVIRPAMFWVIRQTPEGMRVKDTYIHTILLMVLGSGYLSDLIGQSLVIGPFMLGMAIPDGPPLGSAIVNKFNSFTWDVFMPILVTTCGMRTDLSLIKFNNSLVAIHGIIIVLIVVAKVGASLIPPLFSKMPLNDSLALALLLSCKGVVKLFEYTTLRDTEVTISFLPLFSFPKKWNYILHFGSIMGLSNIH